MDPQNGQAADIAVRSLDAQEAGSRIAELAELLVDSVAGGASVNFMAGFDASGACAWWRDAVLPDLEQGRRALLVAEAGGRLVGTVQMVPAPQPNQPHRADIAKMLVHSSARRQGLGARLLAGAEAAARARGRTLLTLDTEAGGSGDRLYRRCGWIAAGTIPNYALMPDGRPCPATFFYKEIDPAG